MVTLDPARYLTAEEDHPVIRYAEVLLTYGEARIQNSGWIQKYKKH
ncbi:RagB/SusD family nutrient uptake outer membrane protein [Bacteroides fragilis]|nr:RagB/SusD family nutrient uptake outer membrane protein [Bacteroides fragilis]